MRRLREAAGLTGEQVVERVGWASASKLSRLENGRSRPDLADVLDLLDLYRVAAATREELIGIARDAGNSRSWLRAYPVMTSRQRAYAELEVGCAEIHEYATAIGPGLLQTPEYARVRIVAGRPRCASERAQGA
jgi:transcriptional regulator with XRE-family HTH domain